MLPINKAARCGALLLLVTAASLRAQVLDATRPIESAFDLAGNWRFHKGDDPRWADPNFDDSGWQVISTRKPWNEQGLGGYSGVFWTRLKVRMPEDARHWKLLLSGRTSYEVYVNGQFLGRYGAMPPHAAVFVPLPAVFELPDLKGAKTVTIALRFWHSPYWADYYDGGLAKTGFVSSSFNGTVTRSVIGSARAINAELQTARTAFAIFVTPALILAGLCIIAGIGLLLLYRSQKGHLEYVWLALYFLNQLEWIPELLRLTDHIPHIGGIATRVFFVIRTMCCSCSSFLRLPTSEYHAGCASTRSRFCC